MPPLLHDRAVRASILARIWKLTSATQRKWGKMTVDQMLWHVSQSLAQSLGQIPSMPSRVPVPKWLSKFVAFNFPWPRGTPTPADLVAVDHYAFDNERQRCVQLINAFTAKHLDEPWTPSASFGRLTGREWSRFQAKHLDHHLRQFGV